MVQPVAPTYCSNAPVKLIDLESVALRASGEICSHGGEGEVLAGEGEKEMIEDHGRMRGKTASRTVHSGISFNLLWLVVHTGSGSIGQCSKTYPTAGLPPTRA